jgi:hypothetical protein
MEKHRDIGMDGQSDCGMERKTKGWRDRGMEKHRDIGMEGLRNRRTDNWLNMYKIFYCTSVTC